MKLGRVDIGEAVRRFLYGARLGEVAREALSVVRLVLSSVWHVRRDEHQSDNSWIRASFRNYGSAVAVSDKNARAFLQRKDALRGGDIFSERRFRLLHEADDVAVLHKDVVNAFPARTICPGAVNQNNI